MILSPSEKTLIILAGPTASGKTPVAASLAAKYDTHVVSADSRQLYKELNIGVAMPEVEILNAVPHHFIRSHSVYEPLNAFEYGRQAEEVLKKIFETHQYVVMTGGSGLFLKAVYHGIDEFPDPSPALRKSLDKMRMTQYGEMLVKLKALDPEYYEVVDRNNPLRVQRALEVCIASGKKYSSLRQSNPVTKKYRIVKLALSPDRETLFHNIDLRLEKMRKDGLTEEARSMYHLRHLSPLKTIGYRELFDFIDGKYNKDDAYEKIRTNTRRYAKKQMTWLNSEGFLRIQKEDVLNYDYEIQ